MGRVMAASRSPKRDYPDRVVAGSLANAGTISVVSVTAAETAAARSMLATHHPLGDAGTPGRRRHYWIVSWVPGRLGQLVAEAAGWHHHARDVAIGWMPAMHNLVK